MVIEQKLLREEPLFFYHHPLHRSQEVVRFIFGLIGELGIENTSFVEFARWWKGRIQTAMSMIIDVDASFLESRSVDPAHTEHDSWLRITKAGRSEIIVPFGSKVNLGTAEWSTPKETAPVPPDLCRIREFDVRTMLGELYTTLFRKLT
jgi:hypothetical protein